MPSASTYFSAARSSSRLRSRKPSQVLVGSVAVLIGDQAVELALGVGHRSSQNLSHLAAGEVGQHAPYGSGLALDLAQLLDDDLECPILRSALVSFPVGRDQRPDVRRLGLSVPVDTAVALEVPVRVPRNVEVDQMMDTVLQVLALARRIGREEHPNVGVR